MILGVFPELITFLLLGLDVKDEVTLVFPLSLRLSGATVI